MGQKQAEILGGSRDLPLEKNLIWQEEEEILELSFLDGEIKAYELKMLQYCQIKGLLRTKIQRRDKEVVFSFDISHMSRPVDIESAGDYVLQLQSLKEALPKYLLRIEGLVVLPEWTFYHSQRQEWQFIYLPLYQSAKYQDLNFFINLFQPRPDLYLQMEMMRENRELGLSHYLGVVKSHPREEVWLGAKTSKACLETNI